MNNLQTPFSESETIPKDVLNPIKPHFKYYMGGGLIVMLAVIGVLFVKGYASDRFRTLELIDTQELLGNHERLLGGKFKLMATVDAELGVEPGEGKLVAFRDSESQKIIPVLITSEELTSRTLNKGQRYKMEVEVTRGGLLQLNHLEKD